MADAKGRVEIEIRDLDQTVIGNPAHDLIRLGLSLASAARGSNLPGLTTAFILEEMIQGYEQALDHPDEKAKKDEITRPVQFVLKEALNRNWRHLARERIEDTKPTIPLGRQFWPLSTKERAQINRLFQAEEVQKLLTRLHDRKDDAKICVADAAYWVKGCSSLERLRYAVLLQVGKHDHALADIKEAVSAAAPHSAGWMPRDPRPARCRRGTEALALPGRSNVDGPVHGPSCNPLGIASAGP